jgi:2-keto-4-pentenoate hydratase/2-oxohepta-3-ene-1,7-dioic acid hydratase in catechol pathway
MAVHIVRFRPAGTRSAPSWGVHRGDHVDRLDLHCGTTGDLIRNHRAELLASLEPLLADEPAIAIDDVELLSPITTPCRVLCQGANYRQHMIESGADPDAKTFNMFFNKSGASVSGPRDPVVRPSHVRLLDYEVELALVLASEVRSSVTVEPESLHEHVAGVCVANDYSARDIQIPQMQFFKGKSYRSFCPVGPVLCLLEPSEMHYLSDLVLSLRVNGEPRQHDTTANLVFKPAATLTELSGVSDLDPGDLLLTGTPAGCALALPSPAIVKLAGALPERLRWKLFMRTQSRRSQYLKAGDIVESEINSRDGHIRLGRQRNVVVDEASR